MKVSDYFIFGNKDISEVMGLNKNINNGFFCYSALGTMILEIIVNKLEKILKKKKFLKIIVPTLQNLERFYKIKKERFKKEIYKIENKNLILNPTCEEIFIDIFDKKIFKERIKKKVFFQTSRKFRNEKRTQGMYKTREFIMNDIYSFCKTKEESKIIYKKVIKIYFKFFKKLKINFYKKKKVDKNIRSINSLEFLTKSKNYEIAHCFELGKCYLTRNYINCFGIGISRLYNILIKESYKKKNLLKIIGKEFVIIPTDYNNKELVKYSKYIYKNSKKKCILDDRNINFKQKLNDFIKITNNIVIISKYCLKNEKVTIKRRKKYIDINLKDFIYYLKNL
ncbi:aminoacyl--tRNA ligase-related protein [Candidatus Vidania fulgoroideorum]